MSCSVVLPLHKERTCQCDEGLKRNMYRMLGRFVFGEFEPQNHGRPALPQTHLLWWHAFRQGTARNALAFRGSLGGIREVVRQLHRCRTCQVFEEANLHSTN